MPDASQAPAPRPLEVAPLDVAIVGGGLAGLYAIHRLRKLGLKVRAFEAGSGIGGFLVGRASTDVARFSALVKALS